MLVSLLSIFLCDAQSRRIAPEEGLLGERAHFSNTMSKQILCSTGDRGGPSTIRGSVRWFGASLRELLVPLAKRARSGSVSLLFLLLRS